MMYCDQLFQLHINQSSVAKIKPQTSHKVFLTTELKCSIKLRDVLCLLRKDVNKQKNYTEPETRLVSADAHSRVC